jgi:hypothetical protein
MNGVFFLASDRRHVSSARVPVAQQVEQVRAVPYLRRRRLRTGWTIRGRPGPGVQGISCLPWHRAGASDATEPRRPPVAV